MRNYIGIKGWKQSLVVVRSTGFFDLFTETTIQTKDVELNFLKTERGNMCMEIVEKHNIEYIIGGMNETHVAIRNRSQRVFTIGGKKHRVGRAYRIEKIKAEDVLNLDIKGVKYPYYIMFTWDDFFHLLLAALQFGYGFVEEKNVKKTKRSSPKKNTMFNLTDNEKRLVKQVETYSKRITTLNMLEEPTDEEQLELDRYFDVNPRKVFQITDGLKSDYWGTVNKIKEKSIGKKDYKEVINSF